MNFTEKNLDAKIWLMGFPPPCLAQMYLFLKCLSHLFWQTSANVPSHLFSDIFSDTDNPHPQMEMTTLCSLPTNYDFWNAPKFLLHLFVDELTSNPLYQSPEQTQYRIRFPVTSIHLERGRYLTCPVKYTRLPWVPSGTESSCQGRRLGFDPWVRKIPWRREWLPTPAFLPGKSHGRRSLAGYSPWGCKGSSMTSQLRTQHTLFSRLNNILHTALCL